MRRLLVAALLSVVVLLANPGPRADAQSPAPAADTTADVADDEGGRPWGRLLVFVPLSAAIGATAVYGRRLARDRGWLSS